jgi:hypothetical protein
MRADAFASNNYDGVGKMKIIRRPAKPGTARALAASSPISVLSRIKLALLDEYKGEQTGYDPYDTSGMRSRDLWSGKRKRA